MGHTDTFRILQRSLCLGCNLLCAGAVWLASSSATRADGDIEVDISADFIKRTIGEAITDELAMQDAEFAWLSGGAQVDASAINDTSLRFSLSLMALGLNLPMAAEATLEVTCDHTGPDLRIGPVFVNPLLPIDQEMLIDLQGSAQEMLSAQVGEIVEPIWERLAKLAKEGIARQVCPHVLVQSDGSIHAELHFGRGCINGQTFHSECAAGYYGSGIDYDCSNGLKFLVRQDCTPNGTEVP